MSLEKKTGQNFGSDQRPFFVELPGIEPAALAGVTRGNPEFDYAKRRETT
jgi:hypothetical protein